MKNILITGASGLVGSRLTELLLQKGYTVSHLTRSPKSGSKIPAYAWNVEKGTIDKTAINNADAIIHLAGAGIAEHRWTSAYRRLIVDSRTKSTALLVQALRSNPTHKVSVFVGASAIGYYGNRGNELLNENSQPQADDFLSETTQLWEASYTPIFTDLHIRTAILRIGIVLSTNGGALPKTDLPLRLGAPGAYFGNGNQYYSWIHIDDLCRLFIAALENPKMSGIYNAVAPQPLTNKEFVATIAKALGKWQLLLPVPELMLRLPMGQMADIVLHSAKVSCQKAMDAGFSFNFPNLPDALTNLYKK